MVDGRGAYVRSALVPCLLLAALGFVMSLQVAVAMAPLRQADERAHAGYAIVLAEGHLPTIDSRIPYDPGRYPGLSDSMFGKDLAHRDIWTANHPPLYYALSVPLVYLGDAIGHPGATLLGMRALNGFGFAATVLLVGLLARELLPRRPAVAVVSSAVALSAGSMTFLGGAIYNDGLANAAAFLTLLAGLRMVRGGISRPWLVTAVASGVAAAALRSTGLVAVAVTCAAVLVAAYLRDRSRRGLLRGLVLGAGPGVAAAVAIGWFYVRNLRLYGDLTASDALFAKFQRTPNGSTLHVLTDPSFYRLQIGSLWTDDDIPNHWGVLGALLMGLTAVGLVVLARRRDLGVPAGAGSDPERLRSRAAWVLVGVHSAIVLVSVAGFIAGGGWIHARYAVPLLPLLCPATSLALLTLGRLVLARLRRLDHGPVTVRGVALTDLRIALPATIALLGLGLLCHFDTERTVDGPVHSVAGAGVIVVADLCVAAVAVLVVRALGRRMRPDPALVDDWLPARTPLGTPSALPVDSQAGHPLRSRKIGS
ncbi:DUF2142 domain-containing protein [Nocardioides cheoyonin]|uniref:DUF2142 domain-containing protein n=1 Tax=Nocardioides cheoyonin TaxID=3156615 RepID=UPI0032B3AE7C